MADILLFDNCDNEVIWDAMNATNPTTGEREFVNDATVTMTLSDSDGNPVDGAEDIPMTYVPGSSGRYRGVIDSTVGLVVGEEYDLVCTAVATLGDDEEEFNDERELSAEVTTRTIT